MKTEEIFGKSAGNFAETEEKRESGGEMMINQPKPMKTEETSENAMKN